MQAHVKPKELNSLRTNKKISPLHRYHRLPLAISMALSCIAANAQPQIVTVGTAGTYTNVDVQTTAANAAGYGLYVQNNGSLTLSGSNNIVSTTGSAAYGLYTVGTGSRITFDDTAKLTLTVSGDNARGVVTAANTSIDLGSGANITTYGANGAGLQTAGANSLIKANNITISTNGNGSGYPNYAAAAYATGGGRIELSGTVNINNTGNYGSGLMAFGAGSAVVIQPGATTTINTSGHIAPGAWAYNGGYIDLGDNTRIITHDSGGTSGDNGGFSIGGGSGRTELRAGNNLYIEVFGPSSMGGKIYTANGFVDLGNNATVIAHGGTGIFNEGGTFTANKATIISDYGIALSMGGINNIWYSLSSTTSLTDSKLIGALGVKSAEGGLNNLTMDGGSITATTGEAIRVDEPTNNLNMLVKNGVTINSGIGVILNAARGDMINFTSEDSFLNGSMLTGAATTNIVLTRSQWNMSGDSNVTNLNFDGGQITYTPQAGVFKTLTVANDYTGNNGTITLNTALEDDTSLTDKLIVGNNTSGNTLLHITNAGGAGAQTLADGIELVSVGGASNGQFKLDSRVTAGLYEYDLFQNGVDTNTADGNWYLRSLKLPNKTSVVATEPTIYLRNLNAASTMFMHTLHDRVGEPQFTDPYKTDGSNPSSAWVRVVSNHTDSTGGNGQVDLNTDTNLVHLGTDIARWSSDGNDRWLFGVMGAYGQSKIDASAKYFTVTPSGFNRNATGKVDGYSVGAYATWYGNKDKPEGAYVDTWAQYGWYDNKVQGNTKAEESYNSSGWTASVEAGYALIARDEGNNRQWIFEPQVQVAYNSYSSDDHTDASGTRITDNNANGVITRVGARLYGRSTSNDNGIQPFVEANWWYSDAKNSLAFNGETMSDGTPDSRYEIKAGLQGQVAKDWLIWGHAGVQFGSNEYNRYEGMVGIKRMF